MHLQSPFCSCSKEHDSAAYNSTTQQLKQRVHKVNMQIMDSKAIAEYDCVITETWDALYWLVLTDVHTRNIAECVIHTFKAHLLAILSGANPTFLQSPWVKLLQQTKLTLNLLMQATFNSSISAWEYFSGLFVFSATLLGPMGCRMIIHNKLNTHKSLDLWGWYRYYGSPILQHYRYFTVVDAKKRQPQYQTRLNSSTHI